VCAERWGSSPGAVDVVGALYGEGRGAPSSGVGAWRLPAARRTSNRDGGGKVAVQRVRCFSKIRPGEASWEGVLHN
jgi:hypothetical protein